jgi:hypothetical protein
LSKNLKRDAAAAKSSSVDEFLATNDASHGRTGVYADAEGKPPAASF